MLKELRFINSKKRLGIVGESVGSGFNVGDIVSVMYVGRIHTSVLVKEGLEVYKLGLCGIKLENLINKHKMEKVISFDLVTNEILRQHAMVEITELDYVEMTLEEIEDKLGHNVKIINKK